MDWCWLPETVLKKILSEEQRTMWTILPLYIKLPQTVTDYNRKRLSHSLCELRILEAPYQLGGSSSGGSRDWRQGIGQDHSHLKA